MTKRDILAHFKNYLVGTSMAGGGWDGAGGGGGGGNESAKQYLTYSAFFLKSGFSR